MKLTDLTDEGKQELALALLLWRDFKKQGGSDANTPLHLMPAYQMFEFAEMLGVTKQLNELIAKLPPGFIPKG